MTRALPCFATLALVACSFSAQASAQTLGRSDWTPPPCAGSLAQPPELPEFILGVQGSGFSNSLMPELGLQWTRTYIKWSSVQPSVNDPELTLDEAMTRPELIEDYIATSSWASVDNQHRGHINAGLKPFPVVGAGWWHSYADLDGQPATPDNLGKDAYIAQMYRTVRATVERYDGDGYLDADGIVIKTWQIENELNQAYLTGLWGWRLPAYQEGVTSAWYDFDFLTRLLAALNQAVHDADPDAITVTNLHTDVTEDINHLVRLPSWEEAAGLWRDNVDVMGFDAYPNYYAPLPVRGGVVGERVAILKAATCGRNIIAMEVGYPAGPEELGFSEANQSAFLQQAVTSLVDAGGSGYFHFKMDSTYSLTTEISEEDALTYQRVGALYENDHVLVLSAWALGNLAYIGDHFLDVVLTVEAYWGLVDGTGEKKASFYTLQGLAAQPGR